MMKFRDPKCQIFSQRGLTLIELMIVIAISGMVIGGIYEAYRSQLRSYVTNQELAEMQQTLRGLINMMQEDIRMAGYDPTGSGDPGITVANRNAFGFTMDITNPLASDGLDNDGVNGSDDPGEGGGDGVISADLGEIVQYTLSGNTIQRTSRISNQLQGIVENIDALDFVYFGQNGNRLDDGGGNLNPGSFPLIRSVQVTIVARSGGNVPVLFYKYTDNRSYRNQLKEEILPPPGDQFRRSVLTYEVTCKNL